MITLTDLLTDSPTSPWCPTCQGDGYLTYVGGPGYFCPSFGNYLPSETQEPCDDCHGSGRDDGTSPLSRARHHLRQLTPSQRLHLTRLHHGQRLPIHASNLIALEALYTQLEDDLGPNHPVLTELDQALARAQLVLDHEPVSHPHDQHAA